MLRLLEPQDFAASDRNRLAESCQMWRIGSNSKGWPWGQGMWMGVSYSGSVYNPKALKSQEGLLQDDEWLLVPRWVFLYIVGIHLTCTAYCCSILLFAVFFGSIFLKSFGTVEAAEGHPRMLVTAARLLSSDGRNNKWLGFPGLWTSRAGTDTKVTFPRQPVCVWQPSLHTPVRI